MEIMIRSDWRRISGETTYIFSSAIDQRPGKGKPRSGGKDDERRIGSKGFAEQVFLGNSLHK
jgi:hypothetical protein